MKKILTIQELREKITKGESKDPIVFLEAIMNGQDPRSIGHLYNLITEINEFTDCSPTEDDWKEVCKFVENECKYKSVSLNESLNAAKNLSEYLHPKRKQIDIEASSFGNSKITPLTPEEIELFKEKFNEDF